MNNIFDMLNDDPQYARMPDYIVPMEVTAQDELVPTNIPIAPYCDQYVISFTMRQMYWATPAEHDQARRFALDVIADSLYSNVRTEAHKALLAIESGDRATAIAAILRIEDATKPTN